MIGWNVWDVVVVRDRGGWGRTIGGAVPAWGTVKAELVEPHIKVGIVEAQPVCFGVEVERFGRDVGEVGIGVCEVTTEPEGIADVGVIWQIVGCTDQRSWLRWGQAGAGCVDVPWKVQRARAPAGHAFDFARCEG